MLGLTFSKKTQTWIDLIVLLVQRDLRVRYRGSFLGYVWSMMNPLLYMLILSFVFSKVMRFKVEHFSVFILSGILAWNLFHQSVVIGTNSIIANGSLLRKVKVPATLFPAASVCSVLVNFFLALGPFVLVSLVTGKGLSPWVLMLPIVLIPYVAFIFGITLILSSLNVSFRDIGHTLEPLLTMLFYATPIVYPLEAMSERIQKLMGLNPLTHFVGDIRKLLYEGATPPAMEFLYIYGLAALSMGIGVLVYRRCRSRFIYNL